MVRFPSSLSGIDNNGANRTICRHIFNLATENPGTKTWVAFKTYWEDTFQEHKDMYKLTAENAGFGANSAMELETHDKTLNVTMANLVAITSSNKPQVKTLLATNAQLAKQLPDKDLPITQLTKEMSNLVSIITKIPGKNHTTNIRNTNTGKLSFDRPRAHSIQTYTIGHMVIVYILITAVRTANTRRRDTKQNQLVQTQWEWRTRKTIGSKDHEDSDQGRKNQKILILLTI